MCQLDAFNAVLSPIEQHKKIQPQKNKQVEPWVNDTGAEIQVRQNRAKIGACPKQAETHPVQPRDLAQPQQFAWQIFDAKVLDKLRDEYRIKRMTKVRADTIEELAKKLEGVDEQQFLKTIKEWNAAVMTEVPFNPAIKDGRGTRGLAVPKTNWANTIDEGPFEAYAVTCGLTFTFGGVRITEDAQVLDVDMVPIKGLYAAGEIVGGIFYFNYPGGSGLINGAVFGRIAGHAASAAVGKTAQAAE